MGETDRKTGGYLYNGRVISGLRLRGFEIEEVVARYHQAGAGDPSARRVLVGTAVAPIDLTDPPA